MLFRSQRHEGDLLAAVNVSAPDFESQNRKHDLNVNYVTLVDRAMSIAIKQNAAFALQIYPPDILCDISMADFDGFDYHKAPQIVRRGQVAMRQLLKSRK